ncbi:hypothetical protein, partial [Pseudomonas sp. RIT-PI-AD]|uniref:hypothetical protein n=1 Tax=Pseudomonas sp. RIT-PI-AD TaxID=3035294 RepID=UPI0021D820E8
WAPVGPGAPAQVLCFAIEAEAEPEILCRLLGLFALHRVLPLDLQVRRQADRLQVRLLQDDLSRHRAEVIAEKIRSLVNVHGVAVQACDR